MRKIIITAALSILFSVQSLAGWQSTANGWIYTNGLGQPVVNQWVQDNGSWYYMDEFGIMKTAAWIKSGNDWYWVRPDGQMLSNGSVNMAGKKYYFGSTGAMLHNTYSPDGEYIGADGAVPDAAKETVKNSATAANITSNITSSDSTDFDEEDAIQEVFELVNKERSKKGRDELVLADDLCELAAVRAEELEEKYSHTRPDGTKASDYFGQDQEDKYSYEAIKDKEYVIGELDTSEGTTEGYLENIAKDSGKASRVMDSWMNSPKHKKNILDDRAAEIGIGVHKGSDGIYYWVQIFRVYG